MSASIAAMDSVGNLIGKVLASRGLKSQAEAALVSYKTDQWLRVHAPDIAASVTVDRIVDGTLHLHCKNSIALQECAHLSPKIKAYLLQSCGSSLAPERIRVARR